MSDTGMGIDPADQQRIFDSFQQGGRAARQVEGTGLGLTLTKRIVELHGGRLWLASEVGHGSTFGFAIPLAPERRRGPVALGPVGGAGSDDDRPRRGGRSRTTASSAELMSAAPGGCRAATRGGAGNGDRRAWPRSAT